MRHYTRLKSRGINAAKPEARGALDTTVFTPYGSQYLYPRSNVFR